MDIDLRDEDLESSLVSHFSKYRSLMPSLALLFSLADGNMETVDVEHSKQAAKWCEYLRGHAERIYSVQADPDLSAALALKRRLEKGLLGDQGGTFTIRDLYRKGWAGLSTPDRARAALEKLEEYHWVRREERKSEAARARLINGGRPSEIYVINPAVLARIQSPIANLSTHETRSS